MNIMADAAIVQNCYVVTDLEKACARMHAMFGIGPFVGGAETVLTEHRYRSKPAPPIRFRGVFAQSGDLNIELVEVLSTGPSAFHDMFERGQQGFHHTAVFCEDYELQRDAWVAAGFEVASEFTSHVAGRVCYIDTRNPLGHMVELYPPSADLRALYAQVRQMSARWDGRDLIVPR
ncbi:VOC family protein [Rhodococcus koreensis]